MIMDEDYNKEIAGYILSIFRTNPFVVMSWGIDPASITIVEVGMKFHVQGFIHTGYVQVVLNEGEDLFEVTLISEEGETLKTIEHIFVDNLISVIDDAVEKCENYQERISQEYGIITEMVNERKWDFLGNSGGSHHSSIILNEGLIYFKQWIIMHMLLISESRHNDKVCQDWDYKHNKK